MGKTMVIYVKCLRDAVCHKLLKSANVSQSTGTVFFLRHSEYIFTVSFYVIHVSIMKRT